MTDDKTRQLENRIETLESTIEKMMPSRRDALKMGGAALVGGAAMSGTASAGTNQVGTIGSASQPVDVESEDINNADTVTTQDLVVNGTATGQLAPVLEAGDNVTIETISNNKNGGTFLTIYNGPAVDILGGTVAVGDSQTDFLYTFADNSTVKKNGAGTSYTGGNTTFIETKEGNDFLEVGILPPAKNVIKVEIGAFIAGNGSLSGELIIKS